MGTVEGAEDWEVKIIARSLCGQSNVLNPFVM